MIAAVAVGACRVLIVEDDRVIASLHRRIVSSHPGFTVIAEASSAELALRMVKAGTPIDLILLDLGLPGANGIQLLKYLRAAGGPDVIAVTARRDTQTVGTLLRLGVIDYLVKPFTPERLREALERFRERARSLSGDQLAQAEIDIFMHDPGHALLPRGIQPETLREVRAALASSGEPQTADRVAETVGIARVTARRYLEYLVTVGQVRVASDENPGPGRPHKLYRWAWESSPRV